MMPSDTQPKVLVVDDDQTLAELLKLMLGMSGFDTSAVFSGQAALDQVAQQLPDAMILDLMMPDIDGLNVLRRLRAADTTRQIPIIILTARTDAATHNACFESGANALLTKPAPREKLVEQLHKVLAPAT